MNKKNPLLCNIQPSEGVSTLAEKSAVIADIEMMKQVINEFKDEMGNDDDGPILVFHVAIIWPTALVSVYPSIRVSIRLKDEESDNEVASWERTIHKPEHEGWEHSLALLMHAAREMEIEYFIMENVVSLEQHPGWIQ